MSASHAPPLLRAGLLDGVALVLAGPGAPRAEPEGHAPGAAIAETCSGLGARVFACPVSFDQQLEIDEEALEQEAQAAGDLARERSAGLVVLAVDGAALFAHRRDQGGETPAESARRGLRACLAASWIVTRAIAASTFLPDSRGGRIVYLAPSAPGEHADAARAGLENLARTLSIEWARHAITTVAIAPPGGAPGGFGGQARVDQVGGVEMPRGGGAAGEVASLTAYLASPAGAYFSGCLLDLRGAAGAST